MGIVNVTPDSFSGDGVLSEVSSDETIERAVGQGLSFVDAGADIIDVGGESTRPGSKPVGEAIELARVVPVIAALRARTDAPISVDTSKAAVAEAALDAGANLVNDVWGLRMDTRMPNVVARADVPVVLMHNRSRPKDAAQEARLGGRYVGVEYDHLVADLLADLNTLVDVALAAGIGEENIIVDPGIGFGKTVSQNLTLLNRCGELRALGYPILLGPSRKSFIGYTLDLPQDQRLEGTGAAVTAAIIHGGVDILRVHDVAAMVRVARMADAIARAF